MLDNLTSEPTLRLLMGGGAVLFAGMAFLRGVGRLILLLLSLAAGGAVAVGCYRYLPGIGFMQKWPPSYFQYAALAAGLIAAWFARKFLNGIAGSGEDSPDRSKVRSGLLGLIPAVLMIWAVAVAARWAGAADFLRHVEQAAKARSAAPLSEAGLVARLSRSLTKGVLGDIMERTDPMTSRESITACALLALQHDDTVWRRAWTHRSTGPIIQHPPFARLRDDHEVANALSFSHYSRLLALSEMGAAMKDATLRERLLALDLETALTGVITGQISTGPPRATVVPE